MVLKLCFIWMHVRRFILGKMLLIDLGRSWYHSSMDIASSGLISVWVVVLLLSEFLGWTGRLVEVVSVVMSVRHWVVMLVDWVSLLLNELIFYTYPFWVIFLGSYFAILVLKSCEIHVLLRIRVILWGSYVSFWVSLVWPKHLHSVWMVTAVCVVILLVHQTTWLFMIYAGLTTLNVSVIISLVLLGTAL